MSGFLLLTLLACKSPTITGTVLDHQGAPVVAAQVAIEGTTLSTLSDDAGRYVLPFVPGMFRLTIQKDGYVSLGRQLFVTEGRELPLAPQSLFARSADAMVTALTPTGPVAVDLVIPAAEQGPGLPALPSLSLPADMWGLVVVPAVDRRSRIERSLSEVFSAGEAPGADTQLVRLRWKASEVRRAWNGAVSVPVNLWTATDVVPARVTAVEGADPPSVIVRPDATLDDGAYAVPVHADRASADGGTLRWAAFIVGKVEVPTPNPDPLDETEGD